MKKIVSVLLSFATLFLLLASCHENPAPGGDDAAATTTITTTAETTVAITTTAKPKPIKDYRGKKPIEMFEGKVFTASNGMKLPYRLYVPEDYDPAQAYPVVLFLHGSGGRGNDNAAQLNNGFVKMFSIVGNPIFDCIILVPQCPTGSAWVSVSSWKECNYSTDKIPESKPLAAALELLQTLPSQYHVDTDRIYATGLSMGGYGTWDLLVRHGDLFAAALPICGGCDSSKAEQLKDIPIWTAHGLKDKTVPPDGTISMYQAIRAAGGEKIYITEYPDMTHNVWDIVYAKEEFYTWLLSHKRSDRP